MHANGRVHADGDKDGGEDKQDGRWVRPSSYRHFSHSQADGERRREGGVVQFTFLKKGIRFSFAKGDMTVFGLALGERRLTGSSLSSGSKPVASMSMATHTDRRQHHHTEVNTGGHR